MERKCFVISPIGAEGSPEREHADDVFNLNVFYELAVAQCAARPVIIMIEKGEAIPFDVRDLRVVEYDLSYRAVVGKVSEGKLVEFARGILSGAFKPEVPFGNGLTPLAGGAARASLCERAADAPESSDWAKTLGASSEYFWISAVSLYGWSRSRGFVALLKEKCELGCQVRILLMDPTNPALPNYLVGTASTLEQLLSEIDLAGKALRRATNSANLEIRRITVAPHLQITLNETSGVAYPYLLSKVRKEGPVLRAKAGGPLHQTLREEFEYLWKDARPPAA